MLEKSNTSFDGKKEQSSAFIRRLKTVSNTENLCYSYIYIYIHTISICLNIYGLKF